MRMINGKEAGRILQASIFEQLTDNEVRAHQEKMKLVRKDFIKWFDATFPDNSDVRNMISEWKKFLK